MPLPRLPALATRAPRCVAALALVLPLLAMAQSAPAPTSVPTPQVESAGAPRYETRTTSLPAGISTVSSVSSRPWMLDGGMRWKSSDCSTVINQSPDWVASISVTSSAGSAAGAGASAMLNSCSRRLRRMRNTWQRPLAMADIWRGWSWASGWKDAPSPPVTRLINEPSA